MSITDLPQPDTSAAAPPWLAIPAAGEIQQPEPEPGPCGCDATRQGVVYTLHFDPPYRPAPDAPGYKSAGHYTGWAKDLDARLAEHEAGQGARLTQVQREAGGTWRLAAVEPGAASGSSRSTAPPAAARSARTRLRPRSATPSRNWSQEHERAACHLP